MRIILSPAKKMIADTDNLAPVELPVYIDKTAEVLNWMKSKSKEELKRSYNQMDNNEVVVTEEVAAVAENNTGIEIEPLFEEQVDFDTFSKSDFRVVKVKNCEAVPKSKKLLRFTLDDGTENERTILSGVHAFYEPEELVGKTLLAIVNLPPRSMMGIDSCGMLLSALPDDEINR